MHECLYHLSMLHAECLCFQLSKWITVGKFAIISHFFLCIYCTAQYYMYTDNNINNGNTRIQQEEQKVGLFDEFYYYYYQASCIIYIPIYLFVAIPRTNAYGKAKFLLSIALMSMVLRLVDCVVLYTVKYIHDTILYVYIHLLWAVYHFERGKWQN